MLKTILATHGLLELAPRLRRRASLVVLHLPPTLFFKLERNASLVRTGATAAGPYGWDELRGQPWALDAYVRPEALQVLVDEVAAGAGADSEADRVPALLRSVEGDWPFPSHVQLAPQPLAALDLLDYPEPSARRLGRDVLMSLTDTAPRAVSRRTARARATAEPRLGTLLEFDTVEWLVKTNCCELLMAEARAPSSTAIRSSRRAPPPRTWLACCGLAPDRVPPSKSSAERLA